MSTDRDLLVSYNLNTLADCECWRPNTFECPFLFLLFMWLSGKFTWSIIFFRPFFLTAKILQKMWKMYILKANKIINISDIYKAAVGIVMFIHSDVLMHFLTQKKVNCNTLISFQQFGQKCMEAVPWSWLNFRYYWDVLLNITGGSVTCLTLKAYVSLCHTMKSTLPSSWSLQDV